ncbi:hypothetical protein CEW92_11715 [Bacillaceae bacterium SAS-127]|nr:hypothetical protein CEW92_11715 [Bacillaceae bacterium SAS-127]
MKKIISLIAVFVLTLSVFVPFGSAQINNENGYEFDESIPEEQRQDIIEMVENDNFEKKVEEGLELQPYINTEATLIEFDHKQALKDGLSPKLVEQTKKDYEKANKYLIKEQQKDTKTMLTSSQFSMMKKSSCSGVNKFVGNLVAGTVYLDSCRTNKLIALIAGGASLTSVISLLPGAAAVGVIAVAIMGVGGAVLSYNNAEGNGVKIRVLKTQLPKNISLLGQSSVKITESSEDNEGIEILISFGCINMYCG